MPKFSNASEKKLEELHIDLQLVLIEAIKIIDFIIICGYRGKEEQEQAFKEGKSLAHFGQSKHNFKPSLAADLAPNPLNWNDIKKFKKLADIILKISKEHGIKILWGGNWLTLKDYPHFELTK
jgi:peptidoglycan LD-endopeptidase CwlK